MTLHRHATMKHVINLKQVYIQNTLIKTNTCKLICISRGDNYLSYLWGPSSHTKIKHSGTTELIYSKVKYNLNKVIYLNALKL